MAESSLTTLIDIDDVQRRWKQWFSFVDGEDGFFNGIPFNARHVMKFNPLDKSLTKNKNEGNMKEGVTRKRKEVGIDRGGQSCLETKMY
jgi:hypothetical protein